VGTNSVRAQPSKQNNIHVLSMYISVYCVTWPLEHLNTKDYSLTDH